MLIKIAHAVLVKLAKEVCQFTGIQMTIVQYKVVLFERKSPSVVLSAADMIPGAYDCGKKRPNQNIYFHKKKRTASKVRLMIHAGSNPPKEKALILYLVEVIHA